MYNSRKTKVRFAKGQLVPGGLTGHSLGPETSSKPVPTPVPAPPSPTPPSPELEVGNEPETEAYDEYTQHAKQQTKAKLESITGRMFQVLNDFEDDHSIEDLQPDLEARSNIQSMITDFKDTCIEREDLLTSLAEWFEDDHIENMLEDINTRRISVAANTEGLRASLIEGKQTSLKLKAINERILSAENRGLNTEHLKLEKEELEKKLMTKINLVDEVEGVTEEPGNGMESKTITTAVTDSWKFAAVEICNMLHQVRESGSEELHELDGKIQGLVLSMNQQTQVIEELNAEIQHQRQMAMFSDQTTIKLSNDNSLLNEEVEMLRGQLIEAKHTISSLQADLHKMELKADFESKRATAANQKKAMSNKNRPKSSSVKNEDDVVKYETQISDLCLEIATLTQENNELKITVENVEKDFDDARQFFENEIDKYSAEIERLTQQSGSHMNQQQPVREKQHTSTTLASGTLNIPAQLPSIPEQGTEIATPLPQTPTRRISQPQSDGMNTYPTFDRRKSSAAGKDVQLLQIKLLDKDNQLQKAQESVDRLQDKVIALEKELQNVRKENDGLMKLQEKSAALIGQASTCLQIKSEQNSYSELCHHERPPKQERARVTSTVTTTVAHQTQSQVATTADTHEVEAVEEPVASEQAEESPAPNFWSVMGSLDDGEKKFGMPEERTDEEKKAESLHLVVKLIEQVNQNEIDFAAADSRALKQVHTELQKICQLVTKFLEYSSNLVNDEADVVSTAMDSLMSHLPEEDKPRLPKQNHRERQGQARMSVAEVKYSEHMKLKDKVVRFADQAIDVLKAGERALSSKINAQKKDLQTVLHAMKDHKRRQSTAFKFTPPDLQDLMLEAHAVSTHDISRRQSHFVHHGQTQPSEKRRALIERLKRYTRPQGNPNIFYSRDNPAGTEAYQSFKGLGSSLFMVNRGLAQYAPQGGINHMGWNQGTNRSFQLQNTVTPDRRNRNTFLQINATHAQDSTDVGQRIVSHPQHLPQEGSMQQGKNMSNSLQIQRRKKAKLHKPFHFRQGLSSTDLGNAVPRTAPAGASLRRATSKNETRNSKKTPKVDPTSKDPLSTTGTQQDGTTFFDLLSHSNTTGKKTNDNQPFKLPPLANL